MELAVEVFSMLADATRVRLILAMRDGEPSVNHLADIVDTGPAAVSQHLEKLRLARIVQVDGTGPECITSWRTARLQAGDRCDLPGKSIPSAAPPPPHGADRSSMNTPTPDDDLLTSTSPSIRTTATATTVRADIRTRLESAGSSTVCSSHAVMMSPTRSMTRRRPAAPVFGPEDQSLRPAGYDDFAVRHRRDLLLGFPLADPIIGLPMAASILALLPGTVRSIGHRLMNASTSTS